ncbi:hypothetical protein D3C81_1875150 [compost metagenome]
MTSKVEQTAPSIIRSETLHPFTVAIVVLHFTTGCLVHQGIAVAKTIVWILVKKIQALTHCITHDEIVIVNQHHIRRLYLLCSKCQFCLIIPVIEIR